MSGTNGVTDPSLPALAADVVRVLRDRDQTLATAESLTGGLVGATLTDVPGASAVYRGGMIVYATELKAELARVSARTLAADGPVAASTAGQLARGAATVCGADWGLATTGVAGPEPQDGHPVGQVFVSVAGPTSNGVTAGGRRGVVTDTDRWVEVRELALTGDRSAIRDQTTRAALLLLLRALGVQHPDGLSAPSSAEI
ncbi:MAG TPA: nicotinamide-nucleotide amidohydrolase family protein [Microlunatus sp.]